MEVLLSKEHYCYQIHIYIPIKSSAYPPPSIIDYPSFLQENQKILTLPPINRGLHTINITYIYIDSQEFFAQTVKLLSKYNLANLLVNLGLILILSCLL